MVGVDSSDVSLRDSGRLRFATSHSFTRRDWPGSDLKAARVLADMATSYIINASELDKQRWRPAA